LVTEDSANSVLQYVDGVWQPLAGATWVGACLDGSYWSWSGPPTLTLTTGGTTVRTRYGCHAFAFGGLPDGLQLVAFGVIDAPPVPFPSFAGDEQTAYEAISARIQISDPSGIRAAYANLDAPIDGYLTVVNGMSAPAA
jgi:hypothetical protein